MTQKAPTADQRLGLYLHAKAGRTPTQRLQAIAHKATNDATRNLKPQLALHDLEELHAHLVYIGCSAAIEYSPLLDPGPHTIDIRFGRFAYLRMRQRAIDWLRANQGDYRTGKLRRPIHPIDIAAFLNGPHNGDMTDRLEDTAHDHRKGTRPAHPTNPFADTTADAFTEPDFTDALASNDRIQRWQHAAQLLGFDTTTWILETLDEQAAAIIDRDAA